MKFSKKSGAKAFDIPMISACGWNLVSIPVTPKDKDVDIVFPGHCGVFTWDGDGYIEPDSIKPGVGYWVCYIEPRKVRVVGRPINAYKRPLAQVWNLIGAPFRRVDFSKLTNVTPYIIDGSLFGFDPINCSYMSATTIEPGRGYWVAALETCTLTVRSLVKEKEVVISKGIEGDIYPSWSFILHIESSKQAVRPVDLKIGMDRRATEGFDRKFDKPLPPPYPGLRFDAYLKGDGRPFNRLKTDTRKTSATASWVVEVESDTGFTISWNPYSVPRSYSFSLPMFNSKFG